jgi:hypothetical protein
MAVVTKALTSLECVCGGEQPHELTYIHECLLTITCEQCGRVTPMPRELVMGQYVRGFRTRLSHLPDKLYSGVSDQPVRFVLTLPVKAAHKVGEVLGEINMISRT